MSDDLSRVEVISPRYPGAPFDDGLAARSSRRRWTVFLAVFVLSCAAGLTYDFLRPAIYQSTATLRISQPSAVPEAPVPVVSNPDSGTAPATTIVSGTGQTKAFDLDAEVQVLTSRPLLAQVIRQLRNQSALPAADADADRVSALQKMLSVEVQRQAGLVNVQARGHDPAFLPALVDTWLDVYMKTQTQSHQSEDTARDKDLEAQLAQLQSTIAGKRDALTAFQRDNDIVSAKRDENAALARLKGLNDTLNKKSEDAVAAQATLDAMRSAIAQGQPVGGPRDMRVVANLEKRVEDLREQLKEYETVYTKAYAAIDPRIQAVQKRLKLAEAKLKSAHADAQRSALAQAEQDRDSAREAVARVRQQLAQAKNDAANFSEKFQENETRTQEIAQLQSQRDRIQNELTRLKLTRLQSTPPMAILQRASTPTRPIAPPYRRDAAIALAASLLLALFATWLVEFLSPRPVAGGGSDHPVHYSLVQMGAAATVPNERIAAPAGVQSLPAAPQLLASDNHQQIELSATDVERLLDAVQPSVQALIMLLLCGLSLDEAAGLTWRDINLATGQVDVPGVSRRSIRLPARVEVVLEQAAPGDDAAAAPLWSDPQGKPLSTQDLDSLVTCAAHDAGFSHARQINGQTLRHTYVAHLARQGVRLTDIEHIVGYIPPSERRLYGALIPPGGGIPAERIKFTYPAFEQPTNATS